MEKTVLNSLSARAQAMQISREDLVRDEIAGFNFPQVVEALVVKFAIFYDIGGVTVISCLMTSWLGLMNSWSHYMGTDTLFSVAPISRDEDGQIIQGDGLYENLRQGYADAIKADNLLMQRAHALLKIERGKLKGFQEPEENECCAHVSGEAIVEFIKA